MIDRGINTIIKEMQSRHIALINEYIQQGVPLAAVKLNLEAIGNNIELILTKQLKTEKEIYETQLKEELDNTVQVADEK